MRWCILNAAILAATALGLAIPSHHNRPSHELDAVAGSTATRGTSLLFSTPCWGCFEDINDKSEFELKTLVTDSGCDVSKVFLNGVQLAPTDDGSSKKGSAVIDSNITSSSVTQRLSVNWEAACTLDDLLLLSVSIDNVPGRSKPSDTSGFLVSMKQSNFPEVLLLRGSPIGNLNDHTSDRTWPESAKEPSNIASLASPVLNQGLSDELQQELHKLYRIKDVLGQLHYSYKDQEKRILALIKQDFHSCHGARCIFQTAIRKAPEFFELVKAHFRHRSHRSHHHESEHANLEMPNGFRAQKDGGEAFPGHHDFDDYEPKHTPFPALFDELQADELSPSPPPPPPPPEHQHGGPPPPPPPHRPHTPEGPGHDHSERPHFSGHRGHGHDRHGPQFFHRHGPHRHPLVFSVGTILFFVLLGAGLFRCIQKKTGFFKNERRRRDRAARREECRNRAAYRRAAIQHKCKRWWSQFRQPQSTSDYEEKRTRILEQEGALEDVMQSEIRELRRAHELVGDMMRAEEGRQRLYHEANFGRTSQTTMFRSHSQQQDGQSSYSSAPTLPAYQPPPPSYDQELEGELTVVDGFTYTPGGSDHTPESSMVDCNSRISFDSDTTAIRD